MAAEANNKYAESVTREDALQLAKQALDTISEECYFLSDVADKCGTYRTKFNYILEKFNEDEEVYDTIHKMRNKCEAIVVRHAAKNKINPAVGIFILKSYHGLMETSKLQQEVEVSDLSAVFKKAISSNEKNEEPGGAS